MSKPISISFGKSKTKTATPSSQNQPRPPAPKSAFRTEPEEEIEEQLPAHEAVVGVSSSGGVILESPSGSGPRVIPCKGNEAWKSKLGTARERRRFSQQQNGATTESESSKKSAPPETSQTTEDQAALSALIDGHTSTVPTRTINQPTFSSTHLLARHDAQEETLTFRDDVASRPESATQDEYAAMPVSEFGMALVRGMGRKRRARGEIIDIKDPNLPDDDKKEAKGKPDREPNAGYLGIGAKRVRIDGAGGAAEDGLGAWGKADIRRSRQGKGDGLYIPVMLRDRTTGELITEKELEERKTTAAEERDGDKDGERRAHVRGEEDRRGRRDRNLLKETRDGRHTNGFTSSSRDQRLIEAAGGSSSRRRNRSRSQSRSRNRSRNRSRDRREERRDEGYRVRDRDHRRDRERDHERDRDRRHGDRDRRRDAERESSRR